MTPKLQQPRVVMCSMWRNDAQRNLPERALHLLAKRFAYPNLRFIWVVGDSDDETGALLRHYSEGQPVRLVNIGHTGLEGYARLSATGNEYFNWMRSDDDFVLVHESDIFSPATIVGDLVDHALCGRCPIAAWPTLELQGERLFYDIWAFRAGGVRFTNHPPYHAVYRADRPFLVDSFGTCFLFRAADTSFLHMEERAVLDLCDQWQQRGEALWVAPELVVVQPADLWQWQDSTVLQ